MAEPAAVLAVRPFENLSGDPEQAWFARGFVDDLVAELSRFGALHVVLLETGAEAATGGAGPTVGRDIDRPQASHGAAAGDTSPVSSEAPRYEVQGSIRLAPGRVRVTARLVEVDGGRALWSQRFDAAPDDPFTVQDEIASAVAGTLAARLDGLRLDQARRTPLTSLAAYECWLAGRALLEQGTVEADLEARSYFERALELDPHYARAWAGLSLSYNNDWSCQAWHLWNEAEQGAETCAERALALDDGDALVHLVLGRVRLVRGDFDRAEQHLDRALALNPNEADVLVGAGLWKVYLGHAGQALELLQRAMALNPRHGSWCEGAAGLALFALGRHGEAHAALARAGPALVDFPAHRAAAAALDGQAEEAARGIAGYLEEFRAKITFGREPGPDEPLRWLLAVNPYRRPEDREHLLRGLRRTGLAGTGTASSPAGDAVTVRPADLPGPDCVFRPQGEVWTVAYQGTGARLVPVKGFHDLARLLARPHQPVHCLELTGAPDSEAGGEAVLDPRARAEYERRVRELAEDLEAARERGDEAGAERAQGELDAIAGELSRALGLGGRSRRLGHPAERARSAVTWRIRSAIRKLAAAHPRLGQHLENSVRTGSFCVYAPERPVTWEV